MHYSDLSVRITFVGESVPQGLLPTWQRASRRASCGAKSSAVMSELSAMLRHVTLIDAIEIGRDLMPRRWKRYVFTPVFVVTALWRPDLVQQAASWLGQQFSERYMEIMASTILSDVAFSQLQ